MVKKWLKAWRNMSAKDKRIMADELGYNCMYLGQVIRGESPGSDRLRAGIRGYFKGCK